MNLESPVIYAGTSCMKVRYIKKLRILQLDDRIFWCGGHVKHEFL